MVDILWKLSTIKPWAIKPEDQKAVQNALKALVWTTIPADHDEAVLWLTRLLAHFPRRDVAQDAVVVSDLSRAMIDARVSLVALAATCEDVWKSATAKHPFMPPSGEILTQAKKRTQTYIGTINRLQAPPALPKPQAVAKEMPVWIGYPTWEEMPVSVRAALWGFLAALDVPIRQTYCKAAKLDYDTVKAWAEELEGPKG